VNTQRSLLVQVYLQQGRYHGAGIWPPSPARVFQALVAGAGPQQVLPEGVMQALLWLEGLSPPIIHAPVARIGQKVQQYVPHNDLDTKEGDPRSVELIRVGKVVQPYLFDGRVPISYLWTFPADSEADEYANRICAVARGLYQLGRGLDAAWATAKVLPLDEGMETFRAADGQTLRPTSLPVPGALPEGSTMLDCAVPGSLDSLTARYAASAQRFGLDKAQRKPMVTFSQPPRALFVAVPYGSSRIRVLYEMRSPTSTGEFVHWRLGAVADIVQRIRDAALARLIRVLPDRKSDIEKTLLGRPVDGRAISPEQRIRIIPLPSIGHEHVDLGIRRIIVDIPASCPLAAEDICWAFSGLPLVSVETGEVFATIIAAENTDMIKHYGIEDKPSRRWRTVTPIALGERYGLDGPVPLKLATAVADALRHEGVGARPVDVRAVRTPFERHGIESARFESPPRFTERNLWHLDVTLDRAIRGPLMLGDGRYFGLGLLAPVREKSGALCYRITGGLMYGAQPEGVARALRRAFMARNAARRGGKMDAYVHGHEGSGPLRDAPHCHFQFDPEAGRLWIMAPHIVDRREPRKREREQWDDVVRAMQGFSRLLAGNAGALDLRAESVDWIDDPLLVSSRIWETVSPYAANRHRDAGSAHAALMEDLQQSLIDAGLPTANVEVLRCRATSNGLEGHVRLTFPVAIDGPILLGRSRFVGGGLFRAISQTSESE